MTALQLTTCLLLAYIIPAVVLLFLGRHWPTAWTVDLGQPSLLMVMTPVINIIIVIVVLIFMCVVCTINVASKHKTRLHRWYYRDYH